MRLVCDALSSGCQEVQELGNVCDGCKCRSISVKWNVKNKANILFLFHQTLVAKENTDTHRYILNIQIYIRTHEYLGGGNWTAWHRRYTISLTRQMLSKLNFKCGCFWMYCMLLCSRVLTWLFFTFYFGGAGVFTSKHPAIVLRRWDFLATSAWSYVGVARILSGGALFCHLAKTVLEIDSCYGWGCTSCPGGLHLHIFPVN